MNIIFHNLLLYCTFWTWYDFCEIKDLNLEPDGLSIDINKQMVIPIQSAERKKKFDSSEESEMLVLSLKITMQKTIFLE